MLRSIIHVLHSDLPCLSDPERHGEKWKANENLVYLNPSVASH